MAEGGANGKTAKYSSAAAAATDSEIEDARLLKDTQKIATAAPLARPDGDAVKVDLGASKDSVDRLHPQKNRLIGAYDSVIGRLELAEKSRRPFMCLVALFILLVIGLIVLLCLWPRVPAYFLEKQCTEASCLRVSGEMLGWINETRDLCNEPYGHFCGRFGRGEGPAVASSKEFYEYEDISKIYDFISKYSTEQMDPMSRTVKDIHSACVKNLENWDKTPGIVVLKKALKNLGGWRLYEEIFSSSWSQNRWSIQEAIPTLHIRYGANLFFKLSVEDHPSYPRGKIISLREGDLGLPHKSFYNLDPTHPIIRAYKTLLSTTVRLLEISKPDQIRNFAETIFNYEKRLVNDAFLEPGPGPQILPLVEVARRAPSLALFETVRGVFSKTRINDSTEILVEHVEQLEALSRVVASTDASLLNDMVAMSTIRRMLPFMAKEIRLAFEEFRVELAGEQVRRPNWFRCTQVLKDFVPLAVDTLLLESDETSNERNEKVLKSIFARLKVELKQRVESVAWASELMRRTIADRVADMRLQVGIPREILAEQSYVVDFYTEYIPQVIEFIENVEFHWKFEKTHMEKTLAVANERDEIVNEIYAVTRSEKSKLVFYSSRLNSIVIKEEALRTSFFDPNYPIPTNLAKIGVELAKALVQAVLQISEYHQKSTFAGKYNCLDRKFNDTERKKNLFATLSAASIAQSALNSLLDSSTEPKGRLPGIQELDDEKLFLATLLQRHCSVPHENHDLIETLVQKKLSEKETFNLIWRNLATIPDAFDCSSKSSRCESIL